MVKVRDPEIACGAEQTTNAACVVTVVDEETTALTVANLAADSALAVLRFSELLELFFGQSKVSAESGPTIMGFNALRIPFSPSPGKGSVTGRADRSGIPVRPKPKFASWLGFSTLRAPFLWGGTNSPRSVRLANLGAMLCCLGFTHGLSLPLHYALGHHKPGWK